MAVRAGLDAKAELAITSVLFNLTYASIVLKNSRSGWV
jgi:hypothetical protein